MEALLSVGNKKYGNSVVFQLIVTNVAGENRLTSKKKEESGWQVKPCMTNCGRVT